jgi:hypothetical protein
MSASDSGPTNLDAEIARYEYPVDWQQTLPAPSRGSGKSWIRMGYIVIVAACALVGFALFWLINSWFLRMPAR